MVEEKSANESGKELSKMKSIEVQSDLLMKEIAFGKFFLKMIGIVLNDRSEFNVKHKQLVAFENYYEKVDRHRKLDYFLDSFYHSFDEFDGLKVATISRKEGMNIMNGIVCVLSELLKKKMIVNDILLILSLLYCNCTEKKESKFVEAVIECAKDCLTSKNQSNARNYRYFKHCLMFRFVSVYLMLLILNPSLFLILFLFN